MWRCGRRQLGSRTIAAFAVATSFAFAQEQGKPPFKAAATAVTVDVVVRDQRGRPVTDLGRSDFQLLEDGVPQQIGDLTLVADPSRDSTPNAGGARAATDPARGTQAAASAAAPAFVALVFDRLSPEARALAHKGALSYAEGLRPQDLAGVFLSDLSLATVQTYTTDRRRLRTAIDDVATRATGYFDKLRIGGRGFGDPDPGVPPTASAESEGPPINADADPNHTRTVDPAAMPGIDIVIMIRRMERAYEAMARDRPAAAISPCVRRDRCRF